ncbi:hypothetical protein [Marinilabilia salmonicolor]|nr:hypothetical protein [Marinilabilia salmonicolor]
MSVLINLDKTGEVMDEDDIFQVFCVFQWKQDWETGILYNKF